MNKHAEETIRTLFSGYDKPKSWADALISDWEYCFEKKGISSEGDAQFNYFFNHCKSFTEAGRAIRLDPPISRPIGE